MALEVKNLPVNAGDIQDTQVQSLGQADPLEEGVATHSSILSWKISDRGVWQATAHKDAKSQTRRKQPSRHTRSSQGLTCTCRSSSYNPSGESRGQVSSGNHVEVPHTLSTPFHVLGSAPAGVSQKPSRK